MDPDAAIAALQRRLEHYPADRYPVQHATTCFHLGTAYLQAGRSGEAVEILRSALAGFAPDGLVAQRARAVNMLGIAHRDRGEVEHARDAFTAAIDGFTASGERAEEAAARFNLGLVSRQLGDRTTAIDCFRAARTTFDEAGAAAQAAAAARELGATLLEEGAHQEATEVLEDAATHAEQRADHAALGVATNLLGLARLADDRPGDAATSFRRSAAAHPRGLRPAEHAMAKANLALALERCGELGAARVSARQAVAVPGAPRAAVEQALAVLGRLGTEAGSAADLLSMLDPAPSQQRAAHWREELARLLDCGTEVRAREVAGLVEGLLARPGAAADHAEAWFHALLELPPAAMETLLGDLLRAATTLEQEEAVRQLVSRTLPRFPMPQWLRVQEALDRLAADVGMDGGWG